MPLNTIGGEKTWACAAEAMDGGYSGGYGGGSSFVLIVVLFILLIIVGASIWNG